MATVYSSWSSSWRPSGSSVDKKFRTWLTYTTTESATQMVIKASMGIQLNSAVGATFTSSYIHYKIGSGSEISKATSSDDKTSFSSGTLTWTWISTQTITINKTTAAQTVTLSARSTASSASWNDYFTASTTINVPALATYTITYKANGGAEADQTNTRAYNQNYTTKAANTFSRTNYNFATWNTAADGSGTNYNANTTYTGTNFPNANTTLYAQWTLNYTKPVINNVQVSRGDKTASTNSWNPIVISFGYTPGKLGSNYQTLNYTISVAGIFANNASSPQTSSGTLTNTVSSTTKTLNFQCSENNSYTVTIKLYDETDSTGITYTASLGSAIFPIDILSDGSAMGIMTPAVSNQAITIQEPHIILLGTSSTKILKDIAHPVGSCITMNTNTNPSTVLGFGTWELIDKIFDYHWVGDAFTFNTTNTTGGNSVAIIYGNTIEFRLFWQNKVAISDSDMTIGVFDLSKLGITDGHVCYPIGYSDGLNAIAMCNLNLNSSSGVLTINDFAIRGTTYPTSTSTYNIDLSYSYLVEGKNTKIDSFCNQFIFKRTA